MSWLDLGMALFKGPFAFLWPLLVLPFFASLLADLVLRCLLSIQLNWRMTAALAAMPGLIMLVLASSIIVPLPPHLGDADTWQELVTHRLTPIIGLLILSQAAFKAILRHRALKHVIRLAVHPCPRLAVVAKTVGIEVREIPSRDCECFVAGALYPRAYVSHEAVQRMSDSELRAMLHHEKAHIAGRDTTLLTFLSFLHSLAPGSQRALNCFLQARECLADQKAIQQEGVLTVASALLTVGKSRGGMASVFGMSGGGVAGRLKAILSDNPPAPASTATILFTSAVIAFNGLLTTWPIVQTYSRTYLHTIVCVQRFC